MTRSNASGLAPHAAAERASELLRDRARLLREIARKKRLLATAEHQASSEAERCVQQMAPIITRHRALIQSLTELFDELLKPGRLSPRARNQIGRFRRALELQGVLEPSDELNDDTSENERWSDRKTEERAQDAPEEPASERVAGAEHLGQAKRTLRDLFRSLARAIHPDQARQEADRVRRTAIMKEVTRAYEDGDFARLVELESHWRGEQALSETVDPEVRCRELSRANAELLKQIRHLTRRIRDVKQAAREASRGLPADELVALAQVELDDLTAIYDVLCAFRDGKLKLADLVRGPIQPPAPKRPRSRVGGYQPW